MLSLNRTSNHTANLNIISNISVLCRNQSKDNVTQKSSSSCELDTETIIILIAYIIIEILIITGNVFVLHNINPLKKRERSNMEVLIGYLSGFDLATNLTLIMHIYDLFTCSVHWPLGWFGCKLVYPIFYVSIDISVCMLVVMSIDRCYAIVSPMGRKFSKKKIHITVFALIIFSFLSEWYRFEAIALRNDGSCRIESGNKSYYISSLTTILSRDIVLTFVFTITGVLIFKHLSKSEPFGMNQSARRKQQIRDVVKMLFTMQVVFTILVIPNDIYLSAMFISRIVPGIKAIKFT